MSKVISIKELENTSGKIIKLKVNEYIDGLDLVEPLVANLTVRDLDEFVEISGTVKANVKLVCDYCLKEFEQILEFDIDEMFAKTSLSDSYGAETELHSDQFITDLCGNDEIDICDLLYQSVILNIPNKKVCGSIDCAEGSFQNEADLANEDESQTDPRLEVFKNLNINPKNK